MLMVYILQQEALTYRLYRDRRGVGPCLYIIMESDLNPLSYSNILIKYADDTNLLVPEHTESTLTQAFTHICDWEQQNKMHINITKTNELGFSLFGIVICCSYRPTNIVFMGTC